MYKLIYCNRMHRLLRWEQLGPWLGEPIEEAVLLHLTPPELEDISAEAQISIW